MAASGDSTGHEDMVLEPGRVRVAGDGDRTVVWLSGEHDLATVGLIDTALVEAMTVDNLDVVVDLSKAAFIDAATLGALVGGREQLVSRGRCLTVRSPPRFPRRVLELSGLADLIETAPSSGTPQDHGASTALGTWVEVPPTARQSERSPPDERGSVDERSAHHEHPGHRDRSGSARPAGPVGR